MNLIDWIIVGIIGVSVLVGLYRGFISSVASLGGCLISLGASYWLTPKIVEYLSNNTSLRDTISSYTGASKIAGEEWAGRLVGSLSDTEITTAVESMQTKLPPPLNTLLENNLKTQAFDSLKSVGDYVSKTIVDAVMAIICFLIAFVVLMILFHIIINLLNAIFKFPVLKQLNTAAGGLFGLARGALLCFVAFAILPLIQTVLPENVSDLIAGSKLAPLFNSSNMIMSIINGKL